MTSLGLTGLSYVLNERLKTETGLVQSVELGVDDERTPLFTRTTSNIDLAFLDDDPELPRRFFEVRWDGVWHVPEDLQVDVYADGDDFVAVRIDDRLVLERSVAAGMHTTSERVALHVGLHRLSVHYVQRGGGYSLNVQWAPAGGRPRPFDPERLFPTRPDREQITRNQRLLLFRRLVAAVWIAPPLVCLLWMSFSAVGRFGRYRLPGMARRVWTLYVSVAGNRSASPTREIRARQKAWTVLGTLVVVLLFGLPLFIGLGSEDLYNDEAIYSYAVDRILETGEWLTPESSPQTALPGDPGNRKDLFFEKPPLKFWNVALPIKLGLLPHDEFGLRFWDIIFGAHVYDRMRGTLQPDHIQPWSYYYAELYRHLSGVGAFGWIVVGAALWILESARQRWKGGVLILAWCLVPFAIISMSMAKLYHYTFPFLPPVALMGAYPVSLLARGAQRLYTASAWTGWAARSAWLRPARYAASSLPVAFLLFAWPVDQARCDARVAWEPPSAVERPACVSRR